MIIIYRYGCDYSHKLLNFNIDGSLCNKYDINSGYPPNMEPNTSIECYPKYHDSLNDEPYIYNRIIHHIADILFKPNKYYDIQYPILRASGDSIIDDWCLHRYLRYILTYNIKQYVNRIFLEILNASSIIEMEKLYNNLFNIILYKKYNSLNIN